MTSIAELCNEQSVLVGRQAIFDRRKNVHGYELLFRDSSENLATVVDGDEATATVMVNAFLEVGLEQIVGSGLLFINMTENFLLSGDYRVLPSKSVVLEVLEDVDPSPRVIEAMADARRRGYRIALDDFVVSETHRVMLEHADLVKVDVLQLTLDQVAAQVAELRQYPVRLLAEKVEDNATFEACFQQGFDYFQGFFFCKPEIVEGVRLVGNRMALLLLLAKFQNPDVDLKELTGLVENDLALSVKLLRFVNSAAVGLHNEVDSVGQAVGMVGSERLRQWASLLVLSNMSAKPSELMRVALARGRMCQGLGRAIGASPSRAFTVGLFSVLDAYFDSEMEALLSHLPLTEEIRSALTSRSGVLGQILVWVTMYERGIWDQFDGECPELQVLSSEYLRSIEWADGVMRSMT